MMFANDERIKLLMHLFSIDDPEGQMLMAMTREKGTDKITYAEQVVFGKAVWAALVRWLLYRARVS